jgi:hypothetical protein
MKARFAFLAASCLRLCATLVDGLALLIVFSFGHLLFSFITGRFSWPHIPLSFQASLFGLGLCNLPLILLEARSGKSLGKWAACLSLKLPGIYPTHIEAARQDGLQTGREYWKTFTNPYSFKSGKTMAYAEMFLAPAASREYAGLVLYEPILTCGPVTHYYIYGLDKTGSRIQDKGQDFVLTNS